MKNESPYAHIMPPDTLLYRVFHSSPVAKALITADVGDYIDANETFTSLLGFAREELLNTPFSTVSLNIPIDRDRILETLREARSLAGIPFVLTSRDGTNYSCIASFQLNTIAGIDCFFITIRDISEYAQAQAELQFLESRFLRFFRNQPLPLLVVDEETAAFVDVNPAACQLYGYSRDELLAMRPADLHPSADEALGAEVFLTWLPSGEQSATVCRQVLRDGSIIEARIHSHMIEVNGRRASLSIVQDVTEQRMTHEALRESEERSRIIADMMTDVILDYDLAGGRINWNQKLSDFFGDVPQDTTIFTWWREHLHPDDVGMIEDLLRAAADPSERYWQGEYRMRRADGRYAHVMDSGYIVRDEDGQPLRYIGSMVDITEQLERAEVTARAALEERQRLARTLHDTVTQSLYSISLLAEAARRRSHSGDLDLMTDYVARLKELTMLTLRQLRLLVYELRPGVLEQEGLAGALRHRLEAVEHRAGIKARLIDETDGAIPAHLQEDFFWIAQEALNNALKHAAASAMIVILRQNGRELMLEVRDNGSGFDLDTLDEAGGLAAIRRRVNDLGGSLEVRSNAGTGTILCARVAA